jgi:hypothetical protein
MEKHSLITPSASPSPRLSAPPAKRPRLSRSANPKLSVDDIHAARRESSLRVLDVWSSLAARYSRPLGEDDIVNIATGKVIKDRGVLRSASKLKFGFLANPEDEDELKKGTGSRAASTPSSDGALVADEDYDELDAFAPGVSLDAELERVKEVLVPPPAPNPADAEDLRAFLEAERRMNAHEEEVVEEDESDSDADELSGRVDSTDESEDSGGLSEWETSEAEDPAPATFTRSSPPLPPDPDAESDDELGRWDVASSCATPPPPTSPDGPSRVASPLPSEDDSDIEIIGFTLASQHPRSPKSSLPPPEPPLPSPPPSTSVFAPLLPMRAPATAAPRPPIPAPKTPERKTVAKPKSTVKPKSKSKPRSPPSPPPQLQTPPRSSASLAEATPDLPSERPKPRPVYKGAKPLSIAGTKTNTAPESTPAPPSPNVNSLPKRVHESSSPLPPSLVVFRSSAPTVPSKLAAYSRKSKTRGRLTGQLTPITPRSPPVVPIPTTPSAALSTPPRSSPPLRVPRHPTQPPEVLITTTTRAHSRAPPAVSTREKGKARADSPHAPHTPPRSSPRLTSTVAQHSPTPSTPSPPRPKPRVSAQRRQHYSMKRKRVISSSSGEALSAPSSPAVRAQARKEGDKTKRVPPRAPTPPAQSSSGPKADSDSDVDAKPRFPPRSQSRGRSQHPAYAYPQYPYPPYYPPSPHMPGEGGVHQPPYAQPLQDPRAQLIISAAMHQLSCLVSGGAPYPYPPPPTAHWTPYAPQLPHSYRHSMGAGAASSSTTPGPAYAPKHPDTLPPSSPEPPSSPVRPRAASLVRRGRSRGRRVSFKLGSGSENDKGESAGKGPSKTKDVGHDNERGRKLSRERMQTPGPPSRPSPATKR